MKKITDRHEAEGDRIYSRTRCVIIHDGKLLTTYTKEDDFYFFPGGHMVWGESIIDSAKRELKEELGEDIEFNFKKILYVREFIEKEKGKHSIEFYLLGDINKFEELEGHIDPEHENGQWWSTWLDLDNLPENLFPQKLAKKIAEDYKTNFPNSGEYVGVI